MVASRGSPGPPETVRPIRYDKRVRAKGRGGALGSREGRYVAVSDEVEPYSPPSDFERTPPQDLAAEQSVLGGMLLSKDAIADVVEIVRSNDFYKPAHALVF